MSGIIAAMPGSEKDLLGLLPQLKHRGPHAAWTAQSGNAALGSCVLRSEGAPPGRVHAEGNGRAAVIDGHLYNGDKGLGEAELLLRLYQEFGTRFAEMLDGDFACAIAADDELILARDPVGLKPLYYGQGGQGMCFASEAKALLHVAGEIAEFPPGHLYSSKQGFQPYRGFEPETPDFATVEQAAQILAQLLRDAVQARMEDNIPGGVLLSGGLDSSVVALLATEFKPDIKTFTVGVVGSRDLEKAREVARILGTEHYEYVYGEAEIAQALPEVIYHLESFDEDCVNGAVAHYFAARLAAQRVGCVLCGEGADEFLCGYDELREASNEVEFTTIMEDLIRNAHNTGLQRMDRMMAAHSLEFRTIFLDARVTSFCSRMPNDWKMHGADKVGKWILRQAFSGRLPDNIVQRKKIPFAQGAGSVELTKSVGERGISQQEYLNNRETDFGFVLKSAAELNYYRIFKEKLPQPSLPRIVARWDPLARYRPAA